MSELRPSDDTTKLLIAVKDLRHCAAQLYSERLWNVNKLTQSLDLLRDFEKVILQTGTKEEAKHE